MGKENNQSNYYREVVPKLIEKYKTAVDQCLNIVDQKIDDKISDDKLHNVLKAKRQAGEDAKFFAKEVDMLENELRGVEVTEETDKKKTNLAKKFAKKPNE